MPQQGLLGFQLGGPLNTGRSFRDGLLTCRGFLVSEGGGEHTGSLYTVHIVDVLEAVNRENHVYWSTVLYSVDMPIAL